MLLGHLADLRPADILSTTRGCGQRPTDARVAVPAVVVAEYLTGVRLTEDPVRRRIQRAFLDDVLLATPIVDYTVHVAEHHAELLAHVRRMGTPHGAHDLIIAATARATQRTVLTTDERAKFGALPEASAHVVAG